MSTHCFIGLSHSDNPIKYVYVHLDGYPRSGVGETLTNFYNSHKKVRGLIYNGSVESLCTPLSKERCKRLSRGFKVVPNIQKFVDMAIERKDIFYLYLYKSSIKMWLFAEIRSTDIVGTFPKLKVLKDFVNNGMYVEVDSRCL